MTIDAATILSKLRSHASALAIFDEVVGHAVTNPQPGTGLVCFFEFGDLGPAPAGSGLSSSSAVLVWTASVYKTMTSSPEDDIEVAIVTAGDKLINAYSGDFTLGGSIRNVDLLGSSGQRLSGRGAYVKPAGGEQVFRAIVVTIPMILNDVWDQGA